MTETPREPGSGQRDPTTLVDALRRLAARRDRDELTEAEYEQAKVRLVEEYRKPAEPYRRPEPQPPPADQTPADQPPAE